MSPEDHTEYLSLLREKVEQLGNVAAKLARYEHVDTVLRLRSDLRQMFEHLGIESRYRPKGKTLCEVFAAEDVRNSTDKKVLGAGAGLAQRSCS